MSPMQNGSKFTDRIIKYLTKSAERKTTRASKSKGHVISRFSFFFFTVFGFTVNEKNMYFNGAKKIFPIMQL